MLLDYPSSQVRLAVQLARAIPTTRGSDNGNNTTNYLGLLGMAPNGFHFIPRTPERMDCYIGFYPGITLVLMDGGTRVAQYAKLEQSYGRAYTSAFAPDTTDYLQVCAHDVLTYLRNSGRLPGTRLVCAGHSLGGAVLLALVAGIALEHPTVETSLLTFGSPRTGGPGLVALMNNRDVTRYMNREDPVPLIPPRGNTAPLLTYVVPADQLLWWNRLEHVRGGLELRANGDQIPRELPSGAIVQPQQSLVAWLTAMATGQNNPHSMSTYIARLEALIIAQGPAPLPPLAGALAEGRGHSTLAEINRDKEAAVARVAEISRHQSQTPIRIPASYVFSAVQQGGTWIVMMNDQVIALGPSKGKAKKLASAGNRFIRQMLREGAVDPVAIVTGFEQFMDAAQYDVNGITPLLNTRL